MNNQTTKLADIISLIDRKRIDDERGWFLKILTGFENNLCKEIGESYITMALPNCFRANHYHAKTSEWFSVIKGSALAIIENPATKERLELQLEASKPQTLFVPAGIAHVFINNGSEEMILFAYADKTYDATDTYLYNLV
jgi:dTDP-4-dehydrorhamnose 3,5-epimerase-like enzyme